MGGGTTGARTIPVGGGTGGEEIERNGVISKGEILSHRMPKDPSRAHGCGHKHPTGPRSAFLGAKRSTGRAAPTNGGWGGRGEKEPQPAGMLPSAAAKTPYRARGNGQQHPTDPAHAQRSRRCGNGRAELSLGQEERRGEKDPKSNTCLLLTAREYTLAVLKLAHKRGFKHRGSRDTNPPRRDVRTEGAGAG